MKRFLGIVVLACGCVGSGITDLDSPDYAEEFDGDLALLPDELQEWAGYEEDPAGGTSRCAKGIHPSEVVPVDPASDPETGEMRVRDGDRVVALPLAEVAFDTIVLGTVADTEVRQVFENPFDEPIEAVYVFPLPHDAAVDAYAIEVGDRTIEGVMKRRAEARAAYERARSEGRRAGLLEQERPNIFTQNVANIPPGESITVVMHMVGPVAQDRGKFELALPTVVGPRFVPGSVPDGDRIASKALPKGYVSCAELSVTVEVDAGAPIDVMDSKVHDIAVTSAGGKRFVTLANNGELLNRDFVLGWSLATKAPKTSLMLAPKGGDGYFQLTIMPPRQVHAGKPASRELVFVLDASGSMYGSPLGTAKAAMRGFLDNLGPDDAFSVIRFSDDASALGRRTLPNTKENVSRALRHIDSLQGQGGTMMVEGVKAALDFPYSDDRARYVLFLTDGYIGNEWEVFNEVDKRLDKARVFSLGVGSSPNRELLDGLARAGRGAATYVENYERPYEAVASFYRRLAHPVLTDLEIEWGELDVANVVPKRIPDLFTGQPVVVYGKMKRARSGTATLVGRANGKRVEIPIRVDVAKARRTDGLASMWARRRIQELEDSLIGAPDGAAKVEAAVTALALKHTVMSKYTSFVAIDKGEVVNPGGQPNRVDVATDLPEGMSHAAPSSGVAVYDFEDDSIDGEMLAPMAESEPIDESKYRRSALSGSPIVRKKARRRGPSAHDAAKRRLEQKAKRGLDKCFDTVKSASSVRVEVAVDNDGSILSVDVTSVSGKVAECLERKISRWKIRSPGQDLLIEFRVEPPRNKRR